MLIANWQLLDVERLAAPERLQAAWSQLVSRSLLPAGLNAPEFMIPLFRHLPGAELVTVKADGTLLMALPMVRRKGFPSFLTNWVSPLSILGLPHLDRDQGEAALKAFLRHERGPVLLTGVPADGPFRDILVAASARFAIVEQWQRAGLRPVGGYASWFAANFERKRRKEFRRLRTRLAEQGLLESRSLGAGDDVRPWVSAFLDLEAGGWKGRRGTALKSQAPVAAAFAEICQGLQAAGKLRFWSLNIDGRCIASMFGIVEGSAAWLGKHAYSAEFARYSPGVLLMLDATERFFAEPGITLVDSCAIPGHPMIENIWRDRIAMADCLVAHDGFGPIRFAAALAAERLRRRSRGLARDLFHSVTRRHRS